MKQQAIKTNIKNVYCYKEDGLIMYSEVRIETKPMYGHGTFNASLNVQRKNIIKERNKLDAILKVVENAISNLNQGELF